MSSRVQGDSAGRASAAAGRQRFADLSPAERKARQAERDARKKRGVKLSSPEAAARAARTADYRLKKLERRIELKVDGRLNKAQVWLMKKVSPDALETMTSSARKARELLTEARAGAATDAAKLQDALSETSKSRAAANLYDFDRANFTENWASNGAYFFGRGILKAIYAWKKRLNPAFVPWDATTLPNSKFNFSGVLKETGFLDLLNVGVRFFTLGDDFNPLQPESRTPILGEIAAAATATVGTLATSMWLRKHTGLGKNRLGKFAGSAVGASIWGSAAGFISYLAFPKESRGGTLWDATKRAFKNSVIFRYTAWELMSAAVSAVFGAHEGAVPQPA